MQVYRRLSGYCTFLPMKPSRQEARQTETRAYSYRRETAAPSHANMTAYYDILDVSQNATQAQIKSAYYKQSFLYHPDRNRSEEAARRFALIAEAYSVLGSEELRGTYDRGLLNPTEPSSHPDRNHHRRRRASDAPRNVQFDFDAFYQAHYGEQLQREKQMRHKRAELQQQQRKDFRRWKRGKLTEMTVGFLLLFGGVIITSLRS